MPRTARTSAEYQHIVVRGIGKQIIFEDDADRRFYLSLLERYQDQTDVTILAYCLMQNHVHLLIHDPKFEVSQFMHKLGSCYARFFNQKYEREGHLFQNRFYNEPVLSKIQLLRTYRYILNNPVKAGICSAAMYPWSSYKEFGKKGGVSNASYFENFFGNKNELRAFLHENDDDEFLDVDIEKRDVNDAEIKEAKSILQISNLSDIQDMRKEKRNAAIRKLKDNGFTVRKIERLTGVSRGVIHRA